MLIGIIIEEQLFSKFHYHETLDQAAILIHSSSWPATAGPVTQVSFISRIAINSAKRSPYCLSINID